MVVVVLSSSNLGFPLSQPFGTTRSVRLPTLRSWSPLLPQILICKGSEEGHGVCQLEVYSRLLLGLVSCSGPGGGYSVFTISHPLSQGFLDGLVGKESACNAAYRGAKGLIPGSGRSPGGGNGNPLQYSCLENSMNRGALWATVHGVTKSRTWPSMSMEGWTPCPKMQSQNKVLVKCFRLRVSRKENVDFVDKFQGLEAPGLNSLCKLLSCVCMPLVLLISLVMGSYAIVLNIILCPRSQGVLRGESCCICVYF